MPITIIYRPQAAAVELPPISTTAPMDVLAPRKAVRPAPARTPARTLADVQERLRSGPKEKAQSAAQQISALNTVARALGCSPADLAADPAVLRERLAGISSAMPGLTKGSWSTILSRLRAALRATDVAVMPARRTSKLSPDWATLYASLPSGPWRAQLGRFITYCSEQDHPPENVCDVLMTRFGTILDAMGIGGRPKDITRAAIRGWNEAVATIQGWPQTHLTLPEVARDGYVLAANAFHPRFQQSLEDQIAYLADPPEDDDDAPLNPLRPKTLCLREFQYREIASALVRQGVAIETLTSIRSLASRDHVERVCRFYADRLRRPDSPQICDLLGILGQIARHTLKDCELATWIGRRIRRIKGGSTRRSGMTEKNRRRLAVFRDERQVRDLLLLPHKLVQRAKSGTMDPGKAARLVRAAVAIEFELICPIRLENLAKLEWGANIIPPARGTKRHLYIPGEKTKTGQTIEMEIPAPTAALLDLYVHKYRKDLIKPECQGRSPIYLFPTPEGKAKSGKVLAETICELLDQELGIKWNIHLFRHLGCFLFLQSNPGQFDVMRRVLGHSQVETTMRFYAEIQQSDAFRAFDTNILRMRAEAMRPSRRASASRKRGQ